MNGMKVDADLFANMLKNHKLCFKTFYHPPKRLLTEYVFEFTSQSETGVKMQMVNNSLAVVLMEVSLIKICQIISLNMEAKSQLS